MILHTEGTLIELLQRATARLESSAGTRIECLNGRLWVTELRVADDILLETGQSYTTRGDRSALVQALRPSSVLFHVPTGETQERTGATRMNGLWGWCMQPLAGRSPTIGHVRA